MDLKQLEYILKIAEENNITKAAEKLFITQSALNQQLLRLEKELGTPLFVRSRSNWHLTPAGEIYVEAAKTAVQLKKETYSRIHDLIEVREGQLRIGLTPERGTEMFASIYPIFYKKYPKVKIEPLEMPVKKQQQEISQGNLDVGFLTLQDSQKTRDAHIPLCMEKIVLAVPGAHPLACWGGKLGAELPEISLKRFETDTFAIMHKGSTFREIYDSMMQEEGIEPAVLLETGSCHSLFQMAAEGICCTVIPISYALDHPSVVYFTIRSQPEWEICASYRKDSYLSLAAKELIALAAAYWADKMKRCIASLT